MAATTEVMGVGSKRRSWRHRASKSIRSILHLPPRTQQSPAVEEVADRKTWMVQESRRTSDVLLRSSPKAPHPSPTTAFERWQQQNEAAPDKSQFTKEYVIETPIVFSIFVSTDSSITPKVTVRRELEENNQKTGEESVEDLIITNKEALELQNARPPVRLQESIDPARFSLHFEDKIFTNNRRASQKVGERGSGLRARGSVQDFAKLRAQCLEDGVLFEDPDFPATDETIFFSRTAPRSFEWKRPHELCEDPRFFYDGASRFDVRQGELGDCWLLAAVSNLTLNPVLFHRVVPDDQSFQQDYAGIFHFRFWQYGRWVDVVIDDRLPTYYGQLVFLHSQEKNEFWSALLEKAYAKLHGSYEALKGGTTCEAMEDFTGGLTEFFELDKAPKNLFTIMLKAYDRSSLMGCAIEPDPEVPEAELPNGLIRGHAYSITAVKLVKIQTPRMSGKIPLLRIRNPWGNEAEWKGAWSDKSAEWRFIPDDEKQELGLTFDADGEFWMSFADFMKNFNRMEICNLNPDSLEDDELDSAKKKWQISTFEGSWIKGVTAGGCRNYLDTFWYNPQYRITLEDPDEEDDEEKCTVIVALMQKNRRRQRKMGAEVLTIGFAIYHLKNPEGLPKPLGKDFFKYTASTVRSPSFINLREVSCRFKLPPGTYCIVPSTFEPNEEGEFVLRVYSEKKNDMEELDDDVGMGEIDDRVSDPIFKQPHQPGLKLHTGVWVEKRALERPVQTKLDDEKEAAIKECFQRIAGEDLEIDARELRDVLDHIFKKEFEFDGFGEDVCRSMVAMMDVDRSGKLGLEEFKQLWLSIYTWKGVFKLYDKDNSGTLSTFELRSALASAGYHLNWHILKALALRYGSKTGTISFDDFILCAVKLKTMIETFKERDPKGTNEATFSLEEWVEKTMYA